MFKWIKKVLLQLGQREYDKLDKNIMDNAAKKLIYCEFKQGGWSFGLTAKGLQGGLYVFDLEMHGLDSKYYSAYKRGYLDQYICLAALKILEHKFKDQNTNQS